MLAAVADDTISDTTPFYRMISSYVDDEMVGKIARDDRC